jgi:hypothetical protein
MPTHIIVARPLLWCDCDWIRFVEFLDGDETAMELLVLLNAAFTSMLWTVTRLAESLSGFVEVDGVD